MTVYGNMRIISEEAEATKALQLMLDKYAPHVVAGRDYRPPVPDELRRTSVFHIEISSWSGKKKEVAHDFSGAFSYHDTAMLRSNGAG